MSSTARHPSHHHAEHRRAGPGKRAAPDGLDEGKKRDNKRFEHDSDSTTGASHRRSASTNPRGKLAATATQPSGDVHERRGESITSKLDSMVRRTEKATTTEALIRSTRDRDRDRDREKGGESVREREGLRDSARDSVRESVRERERESVREREKERESRAEVPQAPWCPEATLIAHTTAPLACRMSIPPLASQAPPSLQPKPLAELSLEAQEAVLIEDLLYVFMGYEGQYVRYAKDYDPSEERDRLQGPTFRILPGLDPSLQDLTQSILRMATYYSALEAFVDVQSRGEFGAVNHALCASVRRILHDYLVMVAQLETQFLTDDAFTVHALNIHTIPTSQTLQHVYALAHELLKRNALLDDETDESSGDEDDDGADDYENILESLREGGDLVPGNMTGKKICKGGVVIGLLTRRLETLSGDPAARAVLTTLLRDASRPYMAMLNEWLHHGAINDPHAEFLIKEHKSIRRELLEQDYTDDYWEKRYILREHDVPPQLEGVKHKVLLAGKYLNVVRECGGVDAGSSVRDVPVSFDDGRFLDNVNSAYAHANASLMQLLLTTHALPDRLRSLKHYFFLDPSDYFSYFLELGASELRKPVKTVNTAKLQSLLDLVLRQPGTAVALDPFKEDVKVEMNDITLIKSLQRVVNITGIEQGESMQPLSSLHQHQAIENDKDATGFTSLQLDYSVPFPVSLVISRKTIWRYQALFRYLLSLRHLESQLSMTWQTQTRGIAWAHRSSASRFSPNAAAGSSSTPVPSAAAIATARSLEIWKRRVWTLRARMLVFVQQLLYFCTAEVIEPNWQKFMSRLQTSDDPDGTGNGNNNGNSGVNVNVPLRDRVRAKGVMRTVDELMQDHVDFLDTCLKECMMTNSKLLRIHSKLMQTCTIFATYSNWLSRELEKADPDLTGNTKPPTMTDDQWRRFKSAKHAAAAASSSSAGADASTLSAAGGGGGGNSGENMDKRIANLFEIIRKWETNFSRHLQILLDALNHYAATETVVLLGLCARLSTANQGTQYAGLRADEDLGA